MSNCIGGAPAAKKAKTDGKPTVKPETIAILRTLDCPTVFNAVHQLTMKPKGGQWADQSVLDPNTQYTDKTVNCMNRPKKGPNEDHMATVGFAVAPIEVTTNEPDSHEEMAWDKYYEYLEATPGPTIAVLKDVDTLFPPFGQRSAVFGDGMSNLHTSCGVEGAICDGVIRDLDGIKRVPDTDGVLRTGFPIWATGEVSGHGRFVIKAFQVPVTVGQLRIVPGDLLMADSGGVVRIPLDIADNVAERAVNIRAKEALVFAYFQSKEFKASEFEAKAGEISKAYDAAHPESF